MMDAENIPVADMNGHGYIISPRGLHRKTIGLNSGSALRGQLGKVQEISNELL